MQRIGVAEVVTVGAAKELIVGNYDAVSVGAAGSYTRRRSR